MKIYKFMLSILSVCFLNISLQADDDETNFTPLVSIRSLYSGVILSMEDNPSSLIKTNWNLREITLPYIISKDYPFGTVQFVSPVNDNVCLGLSLAGKLTTMSCESTAVGNYGSVFSILPTNTSAVQIEAVAGLNECLSIVNSYASSSMDKFGVRKCIKDPNKNILLENLIVIGSAFMPAKVVR
ncbi:hypothetical protein Q4Y15_000268 [Campylobacter fetus]|uniref:Toxin n=5 Tax=Campylobacter fetus TaxID=196 RepID=A0A5L4IWH9_CAMFE|nr:MULTISPECIES: toxin [Campylobacter]OCS23260.1 toxin [Campylobacter fetus subsp. venerealis cfvi97/532]OCS26795.1 toxin [Campylobacter fetus subsp. venerealis cfvB10]OCS30626.1 toxin [Campylobacter fetus subsp. venerealis LMG 6570 = CCUG 33900]OCS41311.1 toxin [Campylobacter fetus subsp. venerealis cfvi02/298]ABK82032.1 cytolethal distending toxin A/C family [Campylobacter fetus subsp. fetus 82-40]